MTQTVKTLPAMWETWVRSLGWEDPLEEGMTTNLPYSCRHCHHDNFSSFATYFPRVLRQVHTGLSLSHGSANLLDSFVKDMLEQIAGFAGRWQASVVMATQPLSRETSGPVTH